MGLFEELRTDRQVTEALAQQISDLQLLFDFIAPEQERELLKKIDQQPWLSDLKRRVQHYGYKYDYRARRIDSLLFVGDLPVWIQQLGEKMVETGILSTQPDQAIVNEYEPGQGIAMHIDCEPCFADTVISLSLGSDCLMKFENAANPEEKLELLFELADVYDDYENFDKVFDCLKLVLELDPNNEEALYKICFWTDFTGRNEEGIRLHLKIIDEYPYNELAWFNLAAAYQGLKLYEKAIDAYKYAITIEEKFDYAYRNMGDAYIRLRKYKEAIEALEKVNELAKPEDVIFEAIGYCYEKLKNPAQARFHYRKASHLRQDDSKLFYKIASTYFNEGQWSACIRQLETAMKIHRNQPEYNLLAGECKLQLGLYREAVQYFSNVVRLRPRNTNGWEALIRSLYKGGFWEEGIEQADAALKITGNKPVFLYYKAALLFATGKSKEALLWLENALQEAPKLLKKMVELNPALLQNQSMVDMLARYKRNKSI